MRVDDDLRDCYPAVADSVPRAREAVAAVAASAGATDERLDRVRLAVSEAVTNAVVHAYGGGDGEIEVRAEIEDEELRVEVDDDGCGLQPWHRQGLGLGLALMALSSDGFTLWERPSGGMGVKLAFRLNSGGPAAGGAESVAHIG